MRLSFPYYAGRGERFAEDIQLPAPGKVVPFKFMDEVLCDCTILSAERVSADQLLIHVEADIPDDHPMRKAFDVFTS